MGLPFLTAKNMQHCIENNMTVTRAMLMSLDVEPDGSNAPIFDATVELGDTLKVFYAWFACSQKQGSYTIESLISILDKSDSKSEMVDYLAKYLMDCFCADSVNCNEDWVTRRPFVQIEAPPDSTRESRDTILERRGSRFRESVTQSFEAYETIVRDLGGMFEGYMERLSQNNDRITAMITRITERLEQRPPTPPQQPEPSSTAVEATREPNATLLNRLDAIEDTFRHEIGRLRTLNDTEVARRNMELTMGINTTMASAMREFATAVARVESASTADRSNVDRVGTMLDSLNRNVTGISGQMQNLTDRDTQSRTLAITNEAADQIRTNEFRNSVLEAIRSLARQSSEIQNEMLRESMQNNIRPLLESINRRLEIQPAPQPTLPNPTQILQALEGIRNNMQQETEAAVLTRFNQLENQISQYFQQRTVAEPVQPPQLLPPPSTAEPSDDPMEEVQICARMRRRDSVSRLTFENIRTAGIDVDSTFRNMLTSFLTQARDIETDESEFARRLNNIISSQSNALDDELSNVLRGTVDSIVNTQNRADYLEIVVNNFLNYIQNQMQGLTTRTIANNTNFVNRLNEEVPNLSNRISTRIRGLESLDIDQFVEASRQIITEETSNVFNSFVQEVGREFDYNTFIVGMVDSLVPSLQTTFNNMVACREDKNAILTVLNAVIDRDVNTVNQILSTLEGVTVSNSTFNALRNAAARIQLINDFSNAATRSNVRASDATVRSLTTTLKRIVELDDIRNLVTENKILSQQNVNALRSAVVTENAVYAILEQVAVSSEEDPRPTANNFDTVVKIVSDILPGLYLQLQIHNALYVRNPLLSFDTINNLSQLEAVLSGNTGIQDSETVFQSEMVANMKILEQIKNPQGATANINIEDILHTLVETQMKLSERLKNMVPNIDRMLTSVDLKQNSPLITQIKNLITVYINLKADCDSLKAEHINIQTLLNNQTDTIKELRGKLHDCESSRNNLDAALSTQTELYEECKMSLATLNSKIVADGSKIKSLQKTIRRLTNDVQNRLPALNATMVEERQDPSSTEQPTTSRPSRTRGQKAIRERTGSMLRYEGVWARPGDNETAVLVPTSPIRQTTLPSQTDNRRRIDYPSMMGADRGAIPRQPRTVVERSPPIHTGREVFVDVQEEMNDEPPTPPYSATDSVDEESESL